MNWRRIISGLAAAILLAAALVSWGIAESPAGAGDDLDDPFWTITEDPGNGVIHFSIGPLDVPVINTSTCQFGQYGADHALVSASEYEIISVASYTPECNPKEFQALELYREKKGVTGALRELLELFASAGEQKWDPDYIAELPGTPDGLTVFSTMVPYSMKNGKYCTFLALYSDQFYAVVSSMGDDMESADSSENYFLCTATYNQRPVYFDRLRKQEQIVHQEEDRSVILSNPMRCAALVYPVASEEDNGRQAYEVMPYNARFAFPKELRVLTNESPARDWTEIYQPDWFASTMASAEELKEEYRKIGFSEPGPDIRALESVARYYRFLVEKAIGGGISSDTLFYLFDSTHTGKMTVEISENTATSLALFERSEKLDGYTQSGRKFTAGEHTFSILEKQEGEKVSCCYYTLVNGRKLAVRFTCPAEDRSGWEKWTEDILLSFDCSDAPVDIGIPNLRGNSFSDVYSGADAAYDMNIYIYWVQAQLKALGYYQGDLSGLFDANTDQAVAAFMNGGSLAYHGEIDQEVVDAIAQAIGTDRVPVLYGGFYRFMDVLLGGNVATGNMDIIWSNLNREKYGPTPNTPYIRPGAAWVQYALEVLGYDPRGIDGKFGAGTEEALRRYDRNHGFSAKRENYIFVTYGEARDLVEQCYQHNKRMEGLPGAYNRFR